MSEPHSMLTQEQLKTLLHYDPETGIFTWKVSSKRKPAGAVAGGSCGPHGYIDITIGGKAYKAHRLAWLYVHGEWPANQIDHINRARADNRIVNLREATAAENAQNMIGRRKSNTGLRGVCFHKKVRKFVAHIRVNGEHIHLGSFDSAEAAHQARRRAEEALHPFRPLCNA